jgi:hypothetical protein
MEICFRPGFFQGKKKEQNRTSLKGRYHLTYFSKLELFGNGSRYGNSTAGKGREKRGEEN